MIRRSKQYLGADNIPSTLMLRSVIAEHRIEYERMRKLHDFYNAKSPILDRKRTDGLPNNKIAHPYARYISSIATGYLIGKPVEYSVVKKNETMEQILDIFRRGSESAENIEIARDQSIYGKGVEYVHMDDQESPMPHTTAISPLNAFVVYNDTYDMEPLFGVYYIQKTKEDGTPDGWHMWVMSDTSIVEYESKELGDLPAAKERKPHYFGGVPLIEYWNDENEKGDFEWVITQIEAYDKLQSDRVNDKEQFVDQILVLTGSVLQEDSRGRSPLQQLKEEHALQLPDPSSKAEYLTSAMDENGNHILRDDILEDIHKLSMVPDLTDKNFAENASGVAMQYKLFALEQLIRTKERWFSEGLRMRLKLYINFLQVKGFEALDVADINITFAHSLPVNRVENSQVVREASNAGVVSIETAVKMLHNGEGWKSDEVDAEIERIKAEKAEESRAMTRSDSILSDSME